MIVQGVLGLLLAVQTPQASLSGIVRDGATGNPLAGAIVSLPDLQREVITDANGRYHVRNLPPGPLHVGIQFLGYASRTLHALVPSTGELQIDVSLRSQPIPLHRLDVRPRLSLRGLEPGDTARFADRSVTLAAIRNHPLLAEPDAFRALSGGHVTIRPEAPSGVHLRGGASDQTAYTLDGIPVFHPYHAGGVFSAWNPDALARLDLFSSAPSPSFPDALSGVIAGVTRTPASRFQTQGSLSTMQARITMDGPLPNTDAGFLLSWRSAFPGVFAPEDDVSYTRGKSTDGLLKLEIPVLKGRLRFLGVGSEDRVDAAARADVPAAPPAATDRNVFQWDSRSVGASFERPVGEIRLRLLGWSAHGGAGAFWSAEAGGRTELDAARRDNGLSASLEFVREETATTLGVRYATTHTDYKLENDSANASPWTVAASSRTVSAFLEHTRPLNDELRLELGASLASFSGELEASPRAQLRWQTLPPLSITLSYARLLQYAQSLRNAESVVGTVFPADLYLAAGENGAPLAVGNQGSLAAEYRPRPGLRFAADAWARDLESLVLVAPRSGEPFADPAFVSGAGSVLGFSFDASLSSARYALIGSYGWQRVRFEYSDSIYRPEHGASHTAEAGILVFPATTSSIRLGVTAILGRRTTTVPGTLEWEACNLLDLGCEFGGSPHYGNTPVGAAALPAYYRVDLGIRHHWHIVAAGRDAMVAAFGTISNVFGRRNVLTWAHDPVTGERVAIEMLPRGPLVVGLDWRF